MQSKTAKDRMSGDSNYRSADAYQQSPSSQVRSFHHEGTNEGIYFPSSSSNDYISAELQYVQPELSVDDLLKIRIKQLAASKILVNIHKKSPLLLVKTHTNVGEAYIFQEYYNQALAHLNSALRLNSLVFRSAPHDDNKIIEEQPHEHGQLYDTVHTKNQKNVDALEAAREQSSKRKQLSEANYFHPNQQPSLTPQDLKEQAEYKNEEFQTQSNQKEGIRKSKMEQQQQLAYALNRPKNNNLEDHQNLEPSSNNQSKGLQKITLNGQQSQEESPINDSPENLLLMNSPPPIQNPFTHIPLDDQDKQQIKRYQTHILMLQGKAYLQLKKPKHALKKLQTALKLNQRFYGEEHVSNASIYTILSQVYSRQRNFKLAIEQLQTVWELTQASRGPNSKSLASVHLELADVYYKQRDFNKAIENQKKGYEIFAGINQSTPQKNKGPVVGPEIIASVALTLSEWLEKAKRIEQAMDVLSKVEEIYEYIFGGFDRRTTKVKRSIAMLYLKINEYEKALNVFKIVQELQKTVYGKDSFQVGKTLKVIGTIQIILNNPNEARQVLQEASVIFKMKGQNKMLRQVYNKLRLLDKTIKGGNRMVIENVTLEEEDEMQNNDDAEQAEDQKKQEKGNENSKQLQQEKHSGAVSKTTYPRSGSRKLKNFKMMTKSKGRMLQPLHKSSGTRTYKSSTSAFSQYQNQRTMPPSPLKKGYPLEQQKIYYDNFHQKPLSPLNQRAMKNGSASSIGFSNNGYYRNVGSSKKRMKKAISQGNIRNSQHTQNEIGSSRVQLPQTSANFKIKGKNINKMMPFPPKLPRNAWASPPKNQNAGRKTVNRSNMNNSNVPKRREQMSTETQRVTSLPYLSSPPPQQQQIGSSSNRLMKNNSSKGSKILISHSRTGGGQKIVFS